MSPAAWAVKTGIMVSVSECRNDFSLHELTTDITPRTIETLIVINAVVNIISTVETACCQRSLTFYNVSIIHHRTIELLFSIVTSAKQEMYVKESGFVRLSAGSLKKLWMEFGEILRRGCHGGTIGHSYSSSGKNFCRGRTYAGCDCKLHALAHIVHNHMISVVQQQQSLLVMIAVFEQHWMNVNCWLFNWGNQDTDHP